MNFWNICGHLWNVLTFSLNRGKIDMFSTPKSAACFLHDHLTGIGLLFFALKKIFLFEKFEQIVRVLSFIMLGRPLRNAASIVRGLSRTSSASASFATSATCSRKNVQVNSSQVPPLLVWWSRVNLSKPLIICHISHEVHIPGWLTSFYSLHFVYLVPIL